MNTNQLADVIKTSKKTELLFDDGSRLRVGKSDIEIEDVPDSGGDELISINPQIGERQYRVLYSSGTLNKQGTSTATELVEFWETNDFFFDIGKTKFTTDEFRVLDDTDQSKQLAFDTSSIGTGTTKTATWRNLSGIVAFINDLINLVTGSASSTDNSVPRYDGTTGKVLQNSTVIIDDDGNVTITGKLTVTEKLTALDIIDPTAIVFDEQATVPFTVVAGKSVLWAKSDSPNNPLFTDDSARDFKLNKTPDGKPLLDGEFPIQSDTDGGLISSSVKEKTNEVAFNKKGKFNKGMKATGGSVEIGQQISLGESASALVIRNKKLNQEFSIAQNLNESDKTFVPRTDPETSTIRQGSDTLNTTVGSVVWFDIVVDDQRMNEITFRAFSDTTGVRLVVRENDALGDIIVITEEDETWELGGGFALTNGGDSVIPLESSVAFFDGAILHFTLEVFTGTFAIRGDILAFGGQPSTFVPYFASRENTFNLQLTADGGGFNRRLTGNVAITPGTNVVVGTGTLATIELVVGESVQIREENFTVATITDNLNWTLSDNHIVGAGPGIGGGLNAIVFAEVDLLSVRNFSGKSRLKVDRLGNLKHTGGRFETTTNDIIHIPDLVGTTAEALSRVDVYQDTPSSTPITNKQFTAGDTGAPSIEVDLQGVFARDDIVRVKGSKFNDGLYEIDIQLTGPDRVILRGVGGTPNIENFTRDQVTTAIETGTITRVNVSVRRTSLIGTIEHGEGSTTPIIFGRLLKAADVPTVATEEFANTNNRFFGELGLPTSQQTWVDIATGSASINLVTDEIVFGVNKQVVLHNDDSTNGSTTSKIFLNAQSWIDINAFGASYGGTSRLGTINGASGFFSGLQADATENPLATGNRRYGLLFNDNGGNLRITEADNTGNNVTMDGTSGNPVIAFDEYFNWECLVPAGLGAAQFFINGDLVTFVPTFFVNGGGLGTSVLISSGSTGGANRVVFHDNFGVTIYEELATKTLTVATMAADIAQIFVPEGRRDYTVIIPDGNPRKIGDSLDFIVQNLGGKLKIRTENLGSPQALFNGLREVEKDIISISEINLINTVANGNVYVGEFEDLIIYDHSGLISSGDNGGPKGMSILNATTFRIEPIKAVIVDRFLNTFFPKQTFIDLPQTDHVITGGGDQIVNTYINKQGVFEFRAAEPTSFSVTGEIFIGKAVMDAGVINVAVFTPNVAYTESVDGQAELINIGGHKTSGSILSAGGANLTLSVTAGNHHQIGRGFLIDVNSPNLCDTEARAVIAFTGTTGNLFLVHADSGGNFIIDSFISNSANPDIDPVQFNNGGTLATVPVNDVTAMRVFQACGTNDIIVYYGTVAYANMAAAEAGFEGEDPEIKTTRDISYICTILVKETVTDLTDGVIAGDVIFKNRSGDREL